MSTNGSQQFDYDWVVIGSGFGGSVAALRLAEKGYRVLVVEEGRRFADAEFASSGWKLRDMFWLPRWGFTGPSRMAVFKDVFVAAGAGVGGGSLVYANTLYRAKASFFAHPQWAALQDWSATLAPHYRTAESMLGVETVPFDSDGQALLRAMASHYGVESTFRRTPCAVFFGAEGVTVPDPYFGGQGPARTGCTRCGSCTMGCRVGAKNTLVKNYLWFAEKRGVSIRAQTRVRDIRPLGDDSGRDGYVLSTQSCVPWWRGAASASITARGVVVAAGALGTNQLLAYCKHVGGLPRISDRLGQGVRTNSESILAVTLPDDRLQPSRDVAISASIHVNEDTHIELVSYGERGSIVKLFFTLLTGDGNRWTRPLKLAREVLRHPWRFLQSLNPRHWGRRTVIFLVMQSLDNALAFVAKRTLTGGVRLQTAQDAEHPNPTFIPEGFDAAQWLARHTGGIAQSMVTEALANIPTTAHILGGAVVGAHATQGVVDLQGRLFGYENIVVCDGSTLPANPGVNPSLTITALAEHFIGSIPVSPHPSSERTVL